MLTLTSILLLILTHATDQLDLFPSEAESIVYSSSEINPNAYSTELDQLLLEPSHLDSEMNLSATLDSTLEKKPKVGRKKLPRSKRRLLAEKQVSDEVLSLSRTKNSKRKSYDMCTSLEIDSDNVDSGTEPGTEVWTPTKGDESGILLEDGYEEIGFGDISFGVSTQIEAWTPTDNNESHVLLPQDEDKEIELGDVSLDVSTHLRLKNFEEERRYANDEAEVSRRIMEHDQQNDTTDFSVTQARLPYSANGQLCINDEVGKQINPSQDAICSITTDEQFCHFYSEFQEIFDRKQRALKCIREGRKTSNTDSRVQLYDKWLENFKLCRMFPDFEKALERKSKAKKIIREGRASPNTHARLESYYRWIEDFKRKHGSR